MRCLVVARYPGNSEAATHQTEEPIQGINCGELVDHMLPGGVIRA